MEIIEAILIILFIWVLSYQAILKIVGEKELEVNEHRVPGTKLALKMFGPIILIYSFIKSNHKRR